MSASAIATAPSPPLNALATDDVRSEGVNARIEEKVKTIESLSTPDAARQQVEALQALIYQALSLVADNGKIAKLGARALGYARSKQEQMRNNANFTPSERQSLQKHWDQPNGEGDRRTGQIQQRIHPAPEDHTDAPGLRCQNAGSRKCRRAGEGRPNRAGDVRGASDGLKLFIRSLTPPEPRGRG